MSAATTDTLRVPAAGPPSWWPTALPPRRLAAMAVRTPFLACDLGEITRRLDHLRAALPDFGIHYAVKCNPAPEVVRTVAARGAAFEVASAGELRMLQRLGIDPAGVLFSNPVKPPDHVAEAAEAGVWRFAVDSATELEKLAALVPGAAVYVRVRVDDRAARFPLSRKFGAEPKVAVALMLRARDLGLRPYGLNFHVGSQCTEPTAWRPAVAGAAEVMGRLSTHGLRVDLLDLGGGFPARYVEEVPPIDAFATVITEAVDRLLPYRPGALVVEPGRYVVAESAVLVSTVLGRDRRGDEEWLYLDVGVYNGLMETQQAANQWEYPLWTSLPGHSAEPCIPYTVAGPSCDSADLMFLAEPLPAAVSVGDRVMIGSAGAYTLSYASHFNGFPPPTPVYV